MQDPFAPPSPNDRPFAGIELGGTKCICILAAGPEHILEQVRIDTGPPETTLGQVERVLGRWVAAHRPRAIGIASFGPLDLDPASPGYGSITTTPKPGWQGTALVLRLARFGLPIGLDTDVVGAALAEGRWGAARGLASHSYLTIGTGIGGGIVAGGRVLGGMSHSELGHIRVRRLPGDDWPGTCPFHGDCVEGLASGPAIEARAGRPASEIGADEDAIWHPVADAIAQLLHALVLTVMPHRILLGGGVIQRRPQLRQRIRALLLESLAGYIALPAITGDIERYIAAPALGDAAGPLGAIALAADACRTGAGAGAAADGCA